MSTENMPAQPTQEQTNIIFYHGGYPLWQFLLRKFNIDIRSVCQRVAKDEPVLATDRKKLVVRTVEAGHCHGLDSSYDSDITFLLNCVNTAFNVLKDGVKQEGKHILKPYKFVLDENHNIALQLVNDPAVELSDAAESFNDIIMLGIVELEG